MLGFWCLGSEGLEFKFRGLGCRVGVLGRHLVVLNLFRRAFIKVCTRFMSGVSRILHAYDSIVWHRLDGCGFDV